MKKYDAYLLDLDGTLVESSPGIFDCFRKALSVFGIVENDEAKLQSFIGPPIHVSLSSAYGFDEMQSAQAIAEYRKWYEKSGVNGCTLLPFVRETLEKLKNDGVEICLATSKPLNFATTIIENFSLGQYFDFLMGADLSRDFCEKPAIIGACLERLRTTDKRKMLMVGDRKYDILGAKHHSLDSAGLLCGFGKKDELVACGADYILPDLSGLTDY